MFVCLHKVWECEGYGLFILYSNLCPLPLSKFHVVLVVFPCRLWLVRFPNAPCGEYSPGTLFFFLINKKCFMNNEAVMVDFAGTGQRDPMTYNTSMKWCFFLLLVLLQQHFFLRRIPIWFLPRDFILASWQFYFFTFVVFFTHCSRLCWSDKYLTCSFAISCIIKGWKENVCVPLLQ